MSEPHRAQVLSREALSAEVVRLVCAAEQPLGALPGQYAVFHTEVPHPEQPGQVLKRAWSFVKTEHVQFVLEIAAVGLASRWLADRKPGDILRYTGPWGRFLLDDGDGPVALLATGTGLSPIGALLDAALDRGRPAALWWQVSDPWDLGRVARWRARGARVEVGAALQVEAVPDARWWMAGDGDVLEGTVARLGLTDAAIERFYPRRPRPTVSP